jgi:formylglycine-generating enzyme required for sulfatase activity
MNPKLDWLQESHGKNNGVDAQKFFRIANELETAGNPHLAATAYDRAYGLAPGDAAIRLSRQKLLDRLAVRERGLYFRYIPAGTFLMGLEGGEPDEMPVHPVQLDAYWMSETPVSWATFCSLAGWSSPPEGMPPQGLSGVPESSSVLKRAINRVLERKREPFSPEQKEMFRISAENRIRLQYCEDATTRAIDWHAHLPEHQWMSGGKPISSRKLFGEPPRDNPNLPWGYETKPMVSVSWYDAEMLCARLSASGIIYRLPTEAEWEKAARGGLIGCAYPWGDQPPSASLCDFDRFDQFSILPMRKFAPNGYGLYTMSGSIWEWTSDWYDAQYYASSPGKDPTGPATGQARIVRGGSWADCAEVVTVSFRMARTVGDWRGCGIPNIGFRICRKASSF